MIEFVLQKLLRARARLFTLLIAPLLFEVGKGTVIIPPLRFYNLAGVRLGKQVLIHSYCWIQVVPGRRNADYPCLEIHDHAVIGMNATISAARKIIIGSHVLLGRNVYIADHGHEFRDIAKPVVEQGLRKIVEVSIGAETWIGQNAVILPGAHIGKHCVIGANSVVSTPIPDYSVAAGAPAKIVRRYDPAATDWRRTGHAD